MDKEKEHAEHGSGEYSVRDEIEASTAIDLLIAHKKVSMKAVLKALLKQEKITVPFHLIQDKVSKTVVSFMKEKFNITVFIGGIISTLIDKRKEFNDSQSNSYKRIDRILNEWNEVTKYISTYLMMEHIKASQVWTWLQTLYNESIKNKLQLNNVVMIAVASGMLGGKGNETPAITDYQSNLLLKELKEDEKNDNNNNDKNKDNNNNNKKRNDWVQFRGRGGYRYRGRGNRRGSQRSRPYPRRGGGYSGTYGNGYYNEQKENTRITGNVRTRSEAFNDQRQVQWVPQSSFNSNNAQCGNVQQLSTPLSKKRIITTKAGPDAKVCGFFNSGTCKFNENCKWKHIIN